MTDIKEQIKEISSYLGQCPPHVRARRCCLLLEEAMITLIKIVREKDNDKI